MGALRSCIVVCLIFALCGCGWGGGSGPLQDSSIPSSAPGVSVIVPSDIFSLGESTWVATWEGGVAPYTVAWDFGGGAGAISAVPATSPFGSTVLMDGKGDSDYVYTVNVQDANGVTGTAWGNYRLGPKLPLPPANVVYDRRTQVLTLNVDFSGSYIEMVDLEFVGPDWIQVMGGDHQRIPGGWISQSFEVELADNVENTGRLRILASSVIHGGSALTPQPEFELSVIVSRPIYISSLGYDDPTGQLSVAIDAFEEAEVEIAARFSDGIQSSEFLPSIGNPEHYTTLVDFSAAEKQFGFAEIAVRDQELNNDTERVWIMDPSAGINNDRIYALYYADRIGLDEDVMVIVTTGELSNPFRFMLNVGLVMDEDVEYVANSFNVGSPGGQFDFPDGIWVDVAPNGFILGPDALIGPGADPEETLGTDKRYDFNISPLWGKDIDGAHGFLFNIRVKYSEPGLKTLSFQLFNGVNRTYYTDMANSIDSYWDGLSNSNPNLQTSIIVE